VSDIDISPKHFRKSNVVGAVLHSASTPAVAPPLRKLSRTAFAIAAAVVAGGAAVGCGNNYRPVVSAINPVGPASQQTKYAIAVSSAGPSALGLVTMIDYSGDTILNTTLIGLNPQYFQLASSGFEGYTLNADGTMNSFDISTGLLESQVLQSTLLPNSEPLSIYSSGTTLYIAETGLNGITELTGLPPAIQQELPTGANTVYTVGTSTAPRVYVLVQGGVAGAAGTAVPIETTSNTTDTAIAVGVKPVYGVMTADGRRAFVLNQGSNNVTVINAQSNALDTFTLGAVVSSTIPVGIAPVWADFAPTLNEVLFANAGTTPPVAVTGYSIASNVITVQTAAQNLTAGQTVTLYGFPNSTFLNGQAVKVLSGGLSSTQFEAAFTHANVASTTEAGDEVICVGITGYSIASNVITVQTAAQNLTAGQTVTLYGFPNSTFLNGQTVTVSATGLSATSFQAAFSHANVTATTESADFLPNGSVTIASIPLCSQTTVTTNPNCDTSNPIDAVGFGQVLANIPVGLNPVMIGVLQDGSQAYIANQGAAGLPGSVSVINLATYSVVATIPAANSQNESDGYIHGHPNWIAVTTGTPTGKVYVTAADSTDITIIRTDIDAVDTHLSLQGYGVAVRVNQP